MPVHRIPGGKTATVYALSAELDEWAASSNAATESDGAQIPLATGANRWRLFSPLALLVGIVLVAATAAAKLILDRLPENPEVANLYLDARDLWARADATNLASAISTYEIVIARDPGFAKAHAGLADAYLLSGEYGSLSYDVAFGRAKRSAERALSISPNLASAHRALGYVAYWWERDPVEAGVRFRRAIELASDDWLTRFWYAGVLADNGEFVAAQREYVAARLGRPGSVAIETHLAWIKWLAGDTAAGIAGLEAVAARAPGDALSRYFLAITHAGKGDFVRYLYILQERDHLRGEPQQSAGLKAANDALKSGGEAALKVMVIDQAIAEEANRPFTDHSLPAFLASSAGDRDRLLAILALADRSKEVWGSSGYTRRMAARWAGDTEITQLLLRRTSPKVEPGP